MSEDIAFGERVLKYKLKGLCNGKWIQLSEGSCIGHKRIEHFPTHSLSVVKLEIEEAKDNPVIKSSQYINTKKKRRNLLLSSFSFSF